MNTATRLYVRPAGEREVSVPYLLLGDKTDFIRDDARGKYDSYRKGSMELPDGFHNHVKWEQDWLAKVLRGGCDSGLASVPWSIRDPGPQPQAASAQEPEERPSFTRAFASTVGDVDFTAPLQKKAKKEKDEQEKDEQEDDEQKDKNEQDDQKKKHSSSKGMKNEI